MASLKDFQIINKLGEGSFSQVYKGKFVYKKFVDYQII